MAVGSTALFNLIIILVIGIVAGLSFNRYPRSWIARLGSTARGDATAALVGIAGAFIGFRISVILAASLTCDALNLRRHRRLACPLVLASEVRNGLRAQPMPLQPPLPIGEASIARTVGLLPSPGGARAGPQPEASRSGRKMAARASGASKVGQ
jgi:hypothetical protein